MCIRDRQGIYQEANQQIVQYSESLASQGAELTKAQGEAKESGDTVESVTQELTTEQAKSESYQALLQAYTYYQQQNLDEAAVEIQKVHVDVQMCIRDRICICSQTVWQSLTNICRPGVW